MKLNELHSIVISASRGEHDLETNRRRNDQMKDDIESAGYDHSPIQGEFTETDKTGKQRKVKEQAFVVATDGDDEKLIDLGTTLAKKYDQEAFVGPDDKIIKVKHEGRILA